MYNNWFLLFWKKVQGFSTKKNAFWKAQQMIQVQTFFWYKSHFYVNGPNAFYGDGEKWMTYLFIKKVTFFIENTYI